MMYFSFSNSLHDGGWVKGRGASQPYRITEQTGIGEQRHFIRLLLSPLRNLRLVTRYMIHSCKILEGPYLSFQLRGFKILTVPWKAAMHGVVPVSIPGVWHPKAGARWMRVVLETRVARSAFLWPSMDDTGKKMN
jgi:hypothetical protein